MSQSLGVTVQHQTNRLDLEAMSQLPGETVQHQNNRLDLGAMSQRCCRCDADARCKWALRAQCKRNLNLCTVSRCHTRGESQESIVHRRESMQKRGNPPWL